MSSISDQLFGPLPKQYCEIFYYMSVASFVFLVLIVISTIGMSLTKRQSSGFYVQSFMFAAVYLIGYVQTRLLYTMCVHSL